MSSERDAAEADRLQHDAAFLRACAELHAHYLLAWRDAQTTEERELLWHRDRALAALETELTKAVERGTFEAKEQARRDRRGSDTT